MRPPFGQGLDAVTAITPEVAANFGGQPHRDATSPLARPTESSRLRSSARPPSASILGLDANRTVALLNHLDAAGWVCRRRDVTDRRRLAGPVSSPRGQVTVMRACMPRLK
jgi:hypothetical protein